MKTARQILIEQVTSLFEDEKKKQEVQEAIEKVLEDIKEEVSQEVESDHAKTKGMIDELTESRDQALARAQEAEEALETVKTEAAETFKSLKEATAEEAEEKVAELQKENEDLKTRLDEVEIRIAEDYEQARQKDRENIVSKVASFLETKTTDIVEKVTAELQADPANTTAEAILQNISEILAGHRHESVDVEASKQNETLQSEIDMLNSRIIQLESRNTSLVKQQEILQEQIDRAEGGSNLHENNEHNEDGDEEDENTSESTRPRSRAAELLSGVFNESSGIKTETADSEDEWLSEGNYPSTRTERASAVDGEGEAIVGDELHKETTETKTSDTDNDPIVEGTGSRRSEIARLAGIVGERFNQKAQ